jgi:hypothetical protein
MSDPMLLHLRGDNPKLNWACPQEGCDQTAVAYESELEERTCVRHGLRMKLVRR